MTVVDRLTTIAGEPIVMRGLSKSYVTTAGRNPVLDGIDIDIAPGELISLVGPSGCGKSTILKILAGLIPYDEGEVSLGGQPPREGRRDVGLMLQQAVLMPWRSVAGNIRLPFDLARLNGPEVEERVAQLVELVGLSHAVEHRPWELSGGMQQRVSLARALSLDPGVMLLDEPFSALDEFKREHLGLEFTRMHEALGRTTILVTHSIPEAVLMSDRIIALGANPGRVLADIRVDLPRPRVAAMIGTPAFMETSQKVRQALVGEDGLLA
ncbi:ABC transporter ATP-binding protein [Intrasporangium calvum]|uniref:ABC transporter related protein n=1 Tax=Intrasporangium calvum (strain ATCC 23552 / DSM 43043 / JCM 3097 / NBRC 12989 / NCIMB 10167 / NRRL B-3866 / 7 KIP) TaxID=710696 RepID=E6SE09_INTC7|nr:ABC transporter ATP-binding protein [Intrasporangium calvum]ADU47622.1 ABC transporter related protein [Intrasporangium calvum DSM 43043]